MPGTRDKRRLTRYAGATRCPVRSHKTALSVLLGRAYRRRICLGRPILGGRCYRRGICLGPPVLTSGCREVLSVAQGELGLEEFLKQLKEYWHSAQLDLVSYKQKVSLIKGWDDLFTKAKSGTEVEYRRCIAVLRKGMVGEEYGR
eukprot:3180008-Rhodomonas_salina.2